MKMKQELHKFKRTNPRSPTAFQRKDNLVTTNLLNLGKSWYDERKDVERDFELIQDDPNNPTMIFSYSESDIHAHSDFERLCYKYGVKSIFIE